LYTVIVALMEPHQNQGKDKQYTQCDLEPKYILNMITSIGSNE
jgi:hypothetical protein